MNDWVFLSLNIEIPRRAESLKTFIWSSDSILSLVPSSPVSLVEITFIAARSEQTPSRIGAVFEPLIVFQKKQK